MATSVKTPDAPSEENNPGQEHINDLADREFNPEEYKRRHEEAAGDSSDPRGDDGSRETQAAGNTSDPRGGLASAEGAGGSLQASPEEGDSLYKKGEKPKPSLTDRLNGSQSLRRYFIFGGIGAGVIALILVIFSFLNVFKLDGLMSNIEQRAFIRHNASLNTRSSKWISAYIEARMMQFGDDSNNNPLFRSNRVDTNSPFTDWYRTMVTSNFERDVFNKQGIKFTSCFGPNGAPRTCKIDISRPGVKDSMDLDLGKDADAIEKGDLSVLSKYQDYFSMDKYNTHKQARQAIKQVVNDNTHWYQVYKRRFLRRNIQNMNGVRNWRFFETTRDKITDKKNEIRNRVLDSILPNNGLVAQVARCFYGLSKCSPNKDVAASQNQIGANILEEDIPDSNTPDEAAAEKDSPAKLDPGFISDSLKKILAQFNLAQRILNIPSTLDMLSYINKSVGSLAKMVVVARGAQAVGLFQVFETARDQMKTGQVNGDEVNALMQNVDTAASSAGWSQVVSGNSQDPPGTTQTGGQCTQDAQALQQKDPQAYLKKYKTNYAPLCADQQIGNASNAQKIQDAYNATIGNVVGPIVSAWSKAKSSPLGPLIGVLEKFNNWIGGITNFVVKNVLNALGLGNDVQKAITWVFAKTSNFLGLTILNGYESAGTIFNWLVQGGSYLAESDARMAGAALTTPDTQATTQKIVAQYQSDMLDQESVYDKVASLDNPDSLAFKGATTLSNVQSDPSTAITNSLHNILGSIGKNFSTIFGGKILAAAPNGYAASQFAGIDTYDYPQQCYDLDPVTAHPIDGTNVLQVFANPKAYGFDHAPFNPSSKDLSALNNWDTERDAYKFYAVVYDVIGPNLANGDDLATHIYNCNLLDTVVRGSLGYLYGYNADSADQVIDSSAPTGSTPATPTGDTPSIPATPAPSNAQQLAQQILQQASKGQIKFNVLYSSDTADGSTPEQNIQETAAGKPANTTTTCGSAGRGAQAPNTSVDLDPSLLQFILELSQVQSIQINALAGQCHGETTSRHYQGKAVDFGCPMDPTQADKIGAKYNISDGTGETCNNNAAHYHYSIGGN